ncbi:MAG: DUF4271 domain-containing protein [Chitinophagaceae bacterium]
MKIFFVSFCIISCFWGYAQKDSLHVNVPKAKVVKTIKAIPKLKDTTVKTNDSTYLLKDSITNDSTAIIKQDSIPFFYKDSSVYQLLIDFPLLNNETPTVMIAAFRNSESKDFIFYLLVGIVLFLAIIKSFFPKYFKNTFNVFFQASFRQKQTREQLSQDNVAALLLNSLFILSTASFVALTAKKFKIINISFWQLFLIAVLSLAVIYIGKYLFTQFLGLVFNKKEEADSYSFLVFIVNKIMGVVLVPFLFLIAFATTGIETIAFNTSIIVILLLFIFRFFSTYKNMSGRLKINAIHFFLYFCSIEILPLLLMYKALSNYIGNGI